MKIVNATKQAEVLYKKAPLIGLKGGRGGAKSVDITDSLIWYANQNWKEELLILCGREFQNSIDDSSKALIEGRLKYYGLESNFTITNNYIKHKKYGHTFKFKGFGRGINAVKSIADVNICWMEEAQDLSEKTIEVLMPSIRGVGATIICSWNPNLPSDPIERLFNEMAPKGTVLETVNYTDNKFFPDTLRLQMEAMKEADYELYLHVWEGHYKSASNKCLFTLSEIDKSIKAVPDFINTFKVASLDVARFGDDKSVLAVKHGAEIPSLREWAKADTVELANKVAEIIVNEDIKAINVDNGGNAGGGVIDVLTRILGNRCKVVEFRGADSSTSTEFNNKRTECYYLLKDYMKTNRILDNKALVDDLSTVLYDYNSKNQKFLLPKDQQKKLIGRSPDYSDACSMLFDVGLKPNTVQRNNRNMNQGIFCG